MKNHSMARIYDLPSEKAQELKDLLAHSEESFVADLSEYPLVVETTSDGKAFVWCTFLTEVKRNELLPILLGDSR